MLINGDTGENQSKKNHSPADFITSLDIANIACGGHIGDEKSITQAVSICKTHKVKIAAHPSYKDKKNFGRKSIFVPPAQLKKDLISQISLLDKICKKQHTRLEFVKPHGALYNDAIISEAVFQVIAETIAQYNPKLGWIFFSSKDNLYFAEKAKKYGLKLLWEAFPDREYYQGKLLDRKEKKAVFQETEQIVERAIQLKKEQTILDYEKKLISMEAQTICLHGDNPASVMAASYIRKQFEV